MRRGRINAAVMAAILAGAPAWADPGDRQIHTIPYTITTGGRYVLTRNLYLSAPGTVITGILVQAHDVVIDLNGFALDGSNIAYGIIQDTGAHQLTVQNGFIRNCFAAIRAPGDRNRFENLGITACYGGITSGPSAVVEGCILGQNQSSAGLALIKVGEGSRVSECLVSVNQNTDGSAACEGIGVGVGSVVRRIVFRGNSFNGSVSYLVQGAEFVEQVVADYNTRLRHGIMGFRAARDCVIADTDLGTEMELFTDGQVAERCVAYDNEASLLGMPQITAFYKVRKTLDCVAAHNRSTAPTGGAGFRETDALGCAAFSNTLYGFLGGSALASVAYRNPLYGFELGPDANLQDCLAAGSSIGIHQQGSVNGARLVDNHAARNSDFGFFSIDQLGTIAVGNSAQNGLDIGGSAKGGAVQTLAGGTTISTNNAWANFQW